MNEINIEKNDSYNDIDRDYRIKRTVAIFTLGCKVNQYETDAMAEMLANKGFEILKQDSKEIPDICIINTCTVTNLADRKSRQAIRKKASMYPDAIIAVTGCFAQISPEIAQSIKGVDIVIGNRDRHKLSELLNQRQFYSGYHKKKSLHTDMLLADSKGLHTDVLSADSKSLHVEALLVDSKSLHTDILLADSYEKLSVSGSSERARAYIKIQEGCSNFCSYCIIPYARGPVRSRPVVDIREEALRIAEAGYKEVVITGINISSYGTENKFLITENESYSTDDKSYSTETKSCGTDDKFHGTENKFCGTEDKLNCANCAENKLCSTENKFRLETEGYSGLIGALKTVSVYGKFERIRLGSLEPVIIDESFVSELVKIKGICNHFHVSLQSGSDTTLKRMNRHYGTNEYEKAIHLLRQAFPDMALTTDMMTGFPGETEEEFNQSFNFARHMRFSRIHVFRFSPRKGTKAATMPDQVPESIKEQRSNKLMELSSLMSSEFHRSFAGRVMDVLVEEEKNKIYSGYTTNYIRVFFPMPDNKDLHSGEILPVRLITSNEDGAQGIYE